MGLLKIIAALQAAEKLLANYGPLASAALAAYTKGGWAGLVIYLETLVAAPTPGGPPVAEVQKVVSELKAAHA